MTCLQKDIVITVQQGVHGRIATSLARVAQKYGVLLHILRGDEAVDCTSVLDVLSMGFTSGTRVRFRVEGKNAPEAMTDIEKILTRTAKEA